MELLLKHRSVRKYLNKDIDDSMLNLILECGIRGSNTGNMQLYSLVVTRSSAKKELLAPLHFNQAMVRTAPVVLTICYDFNRFYKWLELNGTQTDFSNLLWLLTGVTDATILSQNICVSAENFGLGICYLGTVLYNSSEISQVLKLPRGVLPVITLTIGYPEDIPDLVDRLPLEAVVHQEEYEDYTAEKIQAIYQNKDGLETSKQFVLENAKENLAQVYAEVRYKAADNLLFSKKLVDFLTEQGIVF